MTNFIEIEKYLLGALSDEEISEFETKVSNDIEFAREVEIQRLELLTIKKIEQESWLTKMKTWEKPASKANNYRRFGLVALAIILLSSVIFLVIQKPKEPILFAYGLEILPIDHSGLKSSEPTQTNDFNVKFTEACTALETKEYRAAYQLFENLENSLPNNHRLLYYSQYYRGIAALGKGDIEDAKKILSSIKGNPFVIEKANLILERINAE
ncbi:hypothetical protein N9231_02465 [Saprospiraceae bacterium]|nr:hypothetical protein [Saprospiraceae bacterium]